MELDPQNAKMLLWAVAIGLFFLAGYASRGIGKGPKIKELYQRQASKRNGEVNQPNPRVPPILKFPSGNTEIEVYSFYVPGKHASTSSTIVKSKLSGTIDLKFSLFREGAFDRVSKTLGVQDIQMNAEAFDRAYMIKGSDEIRIRQLLGLDIQKDLIACKGDYPVVELDDQRLKLSLNYVVRDEQKLDQFITIVEKLIKRLE